MSGTRAGAWSPDGDRTGVVFDTDMATDCDDAGALAVLHALARRGEAEILATVVNNRGRRSVGAVAAINAFYGRTAVPLGAYQGDAVGTDAADFFADIATDTETYGHAVTAREQAPDAVDVYRRVLGDAAGNEAGDANEVVVVSVGHLNNLYGLLESGPDEHSPLAGPDLVADRVSRLVVMGGAYPSGEEHNFAARGGARFTGPVLERWPTPVLFSGYELGARVRTGSGLAGLPASHPVRRAYAGHPSEPLTNDRQSWDQTAVLAAVRGPKPHWDLGPPGRITVDADGSNAWRAEPNGTQAYLLAREDPSPSAVATLVEDLMRETP
jgi:hypothetical protein